MLALVIKEGISLHHGVIKPPRFNGESNRFWAKFAPGFSNRLGLKKLATANSAPKQTHQGRTQTHTGVGRVRE